MKQKLTLVDNWRVLIRKAWSLKFMALAGVLSGAEVALPFFASSFQPGLFAALSGVSVGAAFVSRLVAQRDL